MHDACRLDELHERTSLGHVTAGACLEALDEHVLVLLLREEHDATRGDPLLDQVCRSDAVAIRDVDVEYHEIRPQALCFGYGLKAVSSLAHDVEAAMTLERNLDGFTEERVLVGE
jgi:hypothetical protein